MSDGTHGHNELEVVCPCCGSRLKIDKTLAKVIAHESPRKPPKLAGLDQATELLQKEAARREALFKEGVEEEKIKSTLLERKFEEALKKTGTEPPTRPLRDIDLD